MVHNRPVEVPLKFLLLKKGAWVMKRSWKAAAAGAAVAAVVAISGASAQTVTNVANTSQKGSLLMYARIDVRSGYDTIVRITNDNNKAVDVKCYYMNERKGRRDFGFTLTKKQPAWWSVYNAEGTFNVPRFPNNFDPRTAGDVNVGELICWAVSKSGHTQINFNHLFGDAIVYNFSSGDAFEYNSWNFKARTGAAGQPVGTPGNIQLNGTEYDYCPGYLIANFTPAGAQVPVGDTFVTNTNINLGVISCNQDLRQDYNLHYTKLEFTVWNEEESKFTGAYECADSYHYFPLNTVDVSPEYFTYDVLGTVSAFFQVRGVASARCNPPVSPVNTEAAGLVCVVSEYNDEYGTTCNAAGTAAGYVLWDASHHPEEVPEKQ
jgi:hypothetical protein